MPVPTEDIRGRFAAAAERRPEFAGTMVVVLRNAHLRGTGDPYQDGLGTAFPTDLGLTVPEGRSGIRRTAARRTSRSSA